MRLDIFLMKNNYCDSRNKAQELIKNKKVRVDDKIINKPSFTIDENNKIEILEEKIYVGRAGVKLNAFIKEIDIEIKNKICLDIGSSTGGFVEVLLENNAKTIYAVDVGTNQLDKKLRDIENIKVYEETDIRNFFVYEHFEIITCDVSFISIHNIINEISRLSTDRIIILFKPQFEVGKDVKRDRNGVVTDKKAIEKVKIDFLNKTKELNWILLNNIESKLKGKNGNVEEFYHFKKK